jgi:AraC-like DNA-binding protein
MQPKLQKISLPRENSFAVNLYSHSKFPGLWHFHEEVELTLILKSTGTRFVGNSIEPFEEGDLCLLGKNLPHTWRNHDSYSQAPGIDMAQALVIQFREEFLGSEFFQTCELAAIKQLLDTAASRGLVVHGETRRKISMLMMELRQSKSAQRIIALLNILNVLSASPDLVPLADLAYTTQAAFPSDQRLTRVYQYIINNFRDDITLTQVAEVASMTPTSFSRYFKTRMRLSFTDFLIDLKITYACKLLARYDINQAQACFEAGFKNISNFNKHFKRLLKSTPKKYQMRYQNQVVPSR